MKSMTVGRNNLDQTASPYLRQHRNNPVWWQPWSQSVLDYARQTNKPLFVSVGYATCHWCHVMAAEAFSSQQIADRLNRDFVSIKVDREERPDIDHFLMQFLLATRGQGGWPLNAFLTSQAQPFLALTYIPVRPRGGMPGFTHVIDQVLQFYHREGAQVPDFNLWSERSSESPNGTHTEPTARAALQRAHDLVRRGDTQWGGFGTAVKFPPHSALLYLLYTYGIYGDEGTARTVGHTLDVMARRGLHDQLQGGFFRYCVDRQWTIPHFEKMLYDQAMALWVYSLAFFLFQEPRYRRVVEGIVRALEDQFTTSAGADGSANLFVSAHDADTEHAEGKTYLWSDADIQGLDAADRKRFDRIFEHQPGGNFEENHHLVRRDDERLSEDDNAFLRRLLTIRRRRPQPEVDRKVVTAWNALAAIGLVYAGRYLGEDDLIARARAVYEALKAHNRDARGHWIRSSLDGQQNQTEFLEDYGALLYLVTLLAEHAPDRESLTKWVSEMTTLEADIERFRTARGWKAAIAPDLDPIPADAFDSPTPSARALAENALVRCALLRDDSMDSPPDPGVAFGPEYQEDFFNIGVLVSRGEFYLLETPALHPWFSLPVNTLQRISTRETWCFRGSCHPGKPEKWNPGPTRL